MTPDFVQDADMLLKALGVEGHNGEPPNQAVKDYVKAALNHAYQAGRVDGCAAMSRTLTEGYDD